MSKKLLYCLSISACLFVGCAKTPTIAPPQAAVSAELQTINAEFDSAHIASTLAMTTPPIHQGQRLTWQFSSKEAISITSNSSLHIALEPTTSDMVSIELTQAPNASLQGAIAGRVLSLAIDAKLGGTAVIHIPESTHYLQLRQAAVVDGHIPEHLLYLNSNGCAQIHVHGHDTGLNYLYVRNTKELMLSSIKTPYLLASVKDSGTVQVHGTMALRELEVQNTKDLSFYWIASPMLNAHITQNSHVFLAGTATYFNGTATGSSAVDIRYLRAERLFVQTHDHATAEVTALDSLNARALDNSNIYYYHQPHVLSHYYKEGLGSILYMGEQAPVCHESYCPPLGRVLPG